VLTRDEMYAARDPRGFRPLALGKLDGAWIVASETCAFDLLGATYMRDIEPGEMVRITKRESSRCALRRKNRYSTAFSSMFISRARTASFSAAWWSKARDAGPPARARTSGSG